MRKIFARTIRTAIKEARKDFAELREYDTSGIYRFFSDDLHEKTYIRTIQSLAKRHPEVRIFELTEAVYIYIPRV